MKTARVPSVRQEREQKMAVCMRANCALSRKDQLKLSWGDLWLRLQSERKGHADNETRKAWLARVARIEAQMASIKKTN